MHGWFVLMSYFTKIFFHLTLFFSWFISFAINFKSFNWGLQIGWVFALLFCCAYSPNFLSHLHRARSRNFWSIVFVFISIFLFALVSYGLQLSGFVHLPYNTNMVRSLGHVGYLAFYFIVFLSVSDYLSDGNHRFWLAFDWFFIKPFFFISIWGLYQWVSTYEYLDYIRIFNNSLSTGFTYERFDYDHRTSSIFPEPSEYSYYLSLLGPIVWGYYRNVFHINSSKSLRLLMLMLWISQALLVKSLSFIVAMPFLVYVCLRHVEKYSVLKTVRAFFGFFILGMIPIYLAMSERLNQTSEGKDGSVNDRYEAFLEGLNYFISSPYFGAGYGAFRGMDQLSFLLGSFGIIGCAVLLYLLFAFLVRLKSQSLVMYGSILCFFVSSILSNNIMDHMFFWIMLAMFSTYQTPQSRSISNNCRNKNEF